MIEDGTGPAIVAGGASDRLIRRMRVSDPPERFQKRAAAAARDALGAAAAAWIPDSTREAIILSGAVEGLSPEAVRALALGVTGEPIRVCDTPPSGLPEAIGRHVIA